MAVAGKSGIIAPIEISRYLGHSGESPDLPDWINAWIAADSLQPWPPVKI